MLPGRRESTATSLVAVESSKFLLSLLFSRLNNLVQDVSVHTNSGPAGYSHFCCLNPLAWLVTALLGALNSCESELHSQSQWPFSSSFICKAHLTFQLLQFICLYLCCFEALQISHFTGWCFQSIYWLISGFELSVSKPYLVSKSTGKSTSAWDCWGDNWIWQQLCGQVQPGWAELLCTATDKNERWVPTNFLWNKRVRSQCEESYGEDGGPWTVRRKMRTFFELVDPEELKCYSICWGAHWEMAETKAVSFFEREMA